MNPTPADTWTDRARRLHDETLRQFELVDEHARQLLHLACQQVSRADACRAQIDKDGLTVTDRFGQVKSHPLLTEERAASNSARLLLRELGLDFEGGADPSEAVRIARPAGYA